MNSAASTVTAPSSSSTKPIASSAPASFPPFFRRRPIGRAPSPPMWACYEQIQPQFSDDSDDDDDDSVSESDDNSHPGSDSEEDEPDEQSTSLPHAGDHMEMDMDVAPADHQNEKMEVDNHHSKVDKEDMCDEAEADDDECTVPQVKKDKGKQRAVEPPEVIAPPEFNDTEKKSVSKKRHHRRRKNQEASFTYRPILTIRKSEGFVWNQDLFVPTYAKDRYIASTSPPSTNLSNGFTPVPASEFNDNYEIEVVEIRVQGNELDGILS